MRGKSEYPVRHADQHNPDGSDPLTGFIRYDFENVGDWVSVETTNRGGPDNVAYRFVDSGGRGFLFRSLGGNILIEMDGGNFDFEAVSGGSPPNLIGNLNSLDFQSLGDVTLQTNTTGDMTLSSANDNSVGAGAVLTLSGTPITIVPGSDIVVDRLTTGHKFQMKDDGGNPIFEVREDGTFHIKTGATWIADL